MSYRKPRAVMVETAYQVATRRRVTEMDDTVRLLGASLLDDKTTAHDWRTLERLITSTSAVLHASIQFAYSIIHQDTTWWLDAQRTTWRLRLDTDETDATECP